MQLNTSLIQAWHIQFILRKKHLKNKQELELSFQNMPLLDKLQYQHCPKNKMIRNEMWKSQTKLVQLKDHTKAKNVKTN